jgi:hypothetical protein
MKRTVHVYIHMGGGGGSGCKLSSSELLTDSVCVIANFSHLCTQLFGSVYRRGGNVNDLKLQTSRNFNI